MNASNITDSCLAYQIIHEWLVIDSNSFAWYINEILLLTFRTLLRFPAYIGWYIPIYSDMYGILEDNGYV